ncbi:MAG: hypothetical protein IKJ87_03455 [Ruminococcus sp.]|nr:hypothetical protein [Ruminococcus sp.]
MYEMLSEIKKIMTENNNENVFLAFDAVPINQKGKYFTVLTMENYEVKPPIYSEREIFMPVSGELLITVAAPMNTAAEEINNYFNNNFGDVINTISGTINHVKGMKIEVDEKINRMTLKVKLKISCIKVISISGG